MANVAKINGYDVKDAEARGDIADIQQALSTAQGDITTLQDDVLNTEADLGDITALSTTVKTSAVNAINEVNGKAEDNADNIGTLASLTTTDKTDLVSAINEVESHAGTNTSNFAPTFSDETSYAVGDYVTYNGVLYKCTTAHTAGAWVAGHFTVINVGSVLTKNSNIEKLMYLNSRPSYIPAFLVIIAGEDDAVFEYEYVCKIGDSISTVKGICDLVTSSLTNYYTSGSDYTLTITTDTTTGKRCLRIDQYWQYANNNFKFIRAKAISGTIYGIGVR